MPRNVESPDHVDIRALRKENVRVGNLLEPGPGTPWEDRGAVGVVAAFFKTWAAMLVRPGRLLWLMRRPETGGDATVFSLVCAFFWGVAWLIHDVIAFNNRPAPFLPFDYYDDGYRWLLHFALGFAASWGLMRLTARVFYKLASAGEMRAKFPLVLANNVFGYCMAPSLFAVVVFPYAAPAGPILALVWIYALFVYASINRLAIKTGGAIICNTIAFVGVVGGGAIAYLVLRWAYSFIAP